MPSARFWSWITSFAALWPVLLGTIVLSDGTDMYAGTGAIR